MKRTMRTETDKENLQQAKEINQRMSTEQKRKRNLMVKEQRKPTTSKGNKPTNEYRTEEEKKLDGERSKSKEKLCNEQSRKKQEGSQNQKRKRNLMVKEANQKKNYVTSSRERSKKDHKTKYKNNIPHHDTDNDLCAIIIIIGELNAKIGKEGFIPNVARKNTMHEVTTDNGLRQRNLASIK
ncbi:hypothetical protein QE152_g40688 [Popillia japonica]|uniref:Uncharacterized protein n=1 Tax=Popillia japonica TaxID=7064 RepID=A0AAW1HG18_POPJA